MKCDTLRCWQAEVFFLDFGNKEVAAISELQPVPSPFTQMPAQAIPVTLFNVTADNQTVLAKEFASLTAEVLLTAVCKTVDGQYRGFYLAIRSRIVASGETAELSDGH